MKTKKRKSFILFTLFSFLFLVEFRKMGFVTQKFSIKTFISEHYLKYHKNSFTFYKN